MLNVKRNQSSKVPGESSQHQSLLLPSHSTKVIMILHLFILLIGNLV
jgi:hypothetical protein